MNKNYLPTIIYCLIIALVLFSSCNRQNKSNLKEQDNSNVLDTKEIILDEKNNSALQIGEYIVEIFEDSKGNLWFGTMALGVARYDGKTLTYFSKKDGLCGNTVLSIAEDKTGNLWFGTHTGASRYDPANSGTSGKIFTNFKETEGLHGAGCKILVDKNGDIWVGTNHGAFRYNDMLLPSGQGRFSKFEIPKPEIEKLSYKWEAGKIWGLIEDSKGNIWFGRDGFGVCKYDPTSGGTSEKSFTHFTKKDGLCSNNVCAIQEDNKGNIWFGSLTSDAPENIKEGGLSYYDGKKITTFPKQEGLFNNDIYTIAKDKLGRLWIGAIGVGLYQYDDGLFTLYKEMDRMDLIYNFGFQSFTEDKNGNIWLGFSGGLFQFKENSIVNITQADLSNED